MNELLNNLVERNRHWVEKGKIATYIPELSKGRKEALGVYILKLDDCEYYGGDF